MYEHQQQQPYYRREPGAGIFVLSVILGLVTLAALLLVGLLLGQRTAGDQARGAERRALVSDAISYACREIEILKAGERQAARKNYRDLGKNLKLLHLKRTPEIERAAKESLDAKLRRYRAKACPINGQIP